MLTNSDVLEFIKFGLGHPFTEIELLDKDIIYRCKSVVLKRYFSPYVPVYKYLLVNTTDPNVQTGETNRYKIIDPDGAGILDLFDLITDNEIIISSNIMGSQGVGYSNLPNWYADYMARRTSMLTTNWYTVYEFIHPMYVDLRPKMTIGNRFMACYEAQHVMFETIPTYRESMFLDLALGYIKKTIGDIRAKYQTIETQFGEVKLNWETIKTDGVTLWDSTIERLEKIPPRVMIDFG